MNLEELRQKRLKWVEANRENNFEDGIKRLLTDLYPDNAHFIYELLQNAEDAQATEVRFILYEDAVEFEHNGDRLFSIENVEAITSIGITTKKDDHTSIGKFGVGFKAVFAYTSTPEIVSGEYHFCIRDLVVPDTKDLCTRALDKNKTLFVFPFDNPKKSPENACAEIEKNLRQLDESTLLFLNKIKKIEYLLPNSTLGFLERREIDKDRIEIVVQHPEDSKHASVVFLHFEKKVDVNYEDGKPKNCRIAVAFGIKINKEQECKIKPLEPGQVCIYFRAEKETSNLQFHLHAPFASTVARDSVRDCPANDELRDHLAVLVAESMIDIRDQRLLDVAFLAMLPNDKDSLAPFYQPIQEKLVEVFQNEKLTPMKRGDHAAASGIHRGSARLSELINDDDLATILGEDHCPPMWIANPPQLNQREHNFLCLLKIPEWKEEHLVSKLSVQSEFITKLMEAKSDKWHQELYALLGDFLSSTPSTYQYRDLYSNRKDKLSNLSIVRLSDVTYGKGGDCYFPGDDVEPDEYFPRVARGVYSSGKNKREQEKACKFLVDIGVGKVEEADRVKTILRQRYEKGTIREQHREQHHEQDIERFIQLIKNEPGQAHLFKDYFIFKINKNLDNKTWWGKPSIVFLDIPYLDTGLRAYYDALGKDRDQKWSLSPKYKESGIEPERLGKFAKAIGARTRLKVVEVDCKENPDWKSLRAVSGQRGIRIDKDYVIPKIDKLLQAPDKKLSKLVWRTMSSLQEKYLTATYQKNQSHGHHKADSQLIHHLRTAEWVPEKKTESISFVKPRDASIECLPKGFPYDAGQKWLEAIEFGKVKREREEQENLEKQRETSEFQQREEAARALNFESSEEAQEAKELLEFKRENPEGFNVWKKRNTQPPFPERLSQNSRRRQGKVSIEHAGSPEKKYEPCMRSVRVTEATTYTRTWLKNQYRNDADQMICQICEERMPFKKRDGDYYFEAVEALSRDYFHKQHEAQFLALCPECAARYKEFLRRDETAMKNLHHAMKNSDDLEIPLKLGELKTNIQFVETHWQDMKTILQEQD